MPFFTKKNTQNILEAFLELLSIKHTKLFSGKYYQEHPHKHNLYGISNMLTSYNIENIAIKTNDKTKALIELEVPYIAHVSSDFVIVLNATKENIRYLWRNKPISVPVDKFLDSWSGIALIAEPDADSVEPGYIENRKKETYNLIRKYFLSFFCLLLMSLLFVRNNIYGSIVSSAALIVNGIGIYISVLLLFKQMHFHSDYADKICSLLLHQGDCNNVLESKAAKLWGIISWSEVGLGYFVSNTIVILCFPEFPPYSALLNICTLPYTVWSVWYQKKIAKQWCPLCLIVQFLLWLLLLVNIFGGYIQFPVISLNAILWTGCIYILPFLIISVIVPVITDNNRMEQITYEINSMKASENIFTSLLKKEQYYQIDKSVSSILWGNPDAENTITIVTNPHCNPCAIMHNRLINLLNNTRNGYCIQYVFTSFSKELESSTRLLISLYQKMDFASFLVALNDWYNYGKYDKEKFIQQYPSDIEHPIVNSEVNKHNQWTDEMKINTTPTLLFNGYRLPENYKVEDLNHFASIKFETA